MSRFRSLPSQTLAVALFAVTGLAAANPIASFVDCSDSFWAVACGTEVPEMDRQVTPGSTTAGSADAEPGGETTPDGEIVAVIDGDHVCTEIDDGVFIVCQTT